MELPIKPGSLNDFIKDNPGATDVEYSKSLSIYRKGLSDLLGVSMEEIHSINNGRLADELSYHSDSQDERVA